MCLDSLTFEYFDSYLKDDGSKIIYSIARCEDKTRFYVKAARSDTYAIIMMPDCVCIGSHGFTAEQLFDIEEYTRSRCVHMIGVLGEGHFSISMDCPYLHCYISELLRIWAMLLLPVTALTILMPEVPSVAGGSAVAVCLLCAIICSVNLFMHIWYRVQIPRSLNVEKRSIVRLRKLLWYDCLADRRPAEQVEQLARLLLCLFRYCPKDISLTDNKE